MLTLLWLAILIDYCYYSSTFATIDSFLLQTNNVNDKLILKKTTALPIQSKIFDDPNSINKKVTDAVFRNAIFQNRTNNNNYYDGTIPSKISPLVLQPNIAGAIDVADGGLLIPLVIPAVTTTNNSNILHENYTNKQQVLNKLNENSATLSTITDTNIILGEVKQLNDSMEVAEDIVFRPLFHYRQQQKNTIQHNRTKLSRFQNTKYFQPYIYTYKRYF